MGIETTEETDAITSRPATVTARRSPGGTTSPTLRRARLATGVSLPYVDQGSPDGIPVVMLHGLTDSWRSFEPVLPHLPPSLRVLVPTQRGHGDAERPAGGYGMRDFAADVAALMDATGVGPAVLVGHSMGAAVALRFALDHPERTRGLLLLGAFSSGRTNPAMVEFWESTIAGLDDPIDPSLAQEFQQGTLARPIAPGQFELFVRESLKVPARVWRGALEGMLDDDLTAELGQVVAPTLCLWGDRDAFARRVDQDQLLAAIAGARLHVHEGAGHALHWEEPERFAADLAGWIDRKCRN